jgi:hypothetical protein
VRIGKWIEIRARTKRGERPDCLVVFSAGFDGSVELLCCLYILGS